MLDQVSSSLEMNSKVSYSASIQTVALETFRGYSLVCASCGANATVPFRPSGDRPVYCSDCFNRMGNYAA